MRIEPLETKRTSWLLRPVFLYMKRRFGKVLTPYRVWAYRPGITIGVSVAMAALEASHKLPARLKALASIRAAQVVGCPF